MSKHTRLSIEDYKDSAEILRVYDVEQEGWEQEPNSVKANLTHIFTHLGKDFTRKCFTNPDVVRDSIAPDSFMYGLRLLRWTRQSPDVLQNGRVRMLVDSRETTAVNMGDSHSLRAFGAGFGQLADYLHATGHAAERKKAQLNRDETLACAAGLLVVSAEIQADEFGFDLPTAFNDRLAELRERFGIPAAPEA